MIQPPSYSHQGIHLGPHFNLTLSLVHATQMPTQGPQGLLNKSTDVLGQEERDHGGSETSEWLQITR